VNSKLPGKPDIVFPESKVAVFIDGCFWHRCPIDFREPSTRRAFWRRKIEGNVKRDREVTKALKEAGWRVKRFWEHDVRKNPAKVAASIGLLVLYVPSSVGNSAKMIHLCSRC
jgi:DNA mismatch endonuclease (patch repair protein)